MALSTGEINLAQIQAEYGGVNPIGLSEYYSRDDGVSDSGAISMNQFHGKTRDLYLSLGSYAHGWLSWHTPSGSNYNSIKGKQASFDAASTNHTVGVVNLPRPGILDRIYIVGTSASNVWTNLDKIYFGGTQVWDGNMVGDFSTTDPGTIIDVTNTHFSAGSHSVRLDTYAQYESNDRLYISSMQFFFRHD